MGESPSWIKHALACSLEAGEKHTPAFRWPVQKCTTSGWHRGTPLGSFPTTELAVTWGVRAGTIPLWQMVNSCPWTHAQCAHPDEAFWRFMNAFTKSFWDACLDPAYFVQPQMVVFQETCKWAVFALCWRRLGKLGKVPRDRLLGTGSARQQASVSLGTDTTSSSAPPSSPLTLARTYPLWAPASDSLKQDHAICLEGLLERWE